MTSEHTGEAESPRIFGFPDSMLPPLVGRWLRGGEWVFVGETFEDRSDWEKGSVELADAFEREMHVVEELESRAREDYTRDTNIWISDEDRRNPMWSPNPKVHMARHLGIGTERYSNLEQTMADELATRTIFASSKVKASADLSNFQQYRPMVTGRNAFTAFAGIVDDMWADADDLDETSRREKLIAFCETYGPPHVVYEYDLDMGFSRLTAEEMESVIVNPTRLRTLIRFYASGRFSRIISCEYRSTIEEAQFIALAIRCYQAIADHNQGGDWVMNQPALKKFMFSEKAKKLFADKKRRRGVDIWPWTMDWDQRDRFNDNPEAFFDNPDFWWSYLPFIMTLGPYNSNPDVAMFRCDDETKRYDEYTRSFIEAREYDDLMSMMWRQLREAILANSPVKRCARDGCGVVFAGRPNRKYCTDECKNQVKAKKWRDNPTNKEQQKKARRAKRTTYK